MLDYGDNCTTAMHSSGLVLGYRMGRSPGNRVVCASTLSTYISVTVHEENILAKNVTDNSSYRAVECRTLETSPQLSHTTAFSQ